MQTETHKSRDTRDYSHFLFMPELDVWEKLVILFVCADIQQDLAQMSDPYGKVTL